MARIRLAGIIPMGDGFALMHRKDVKKRKDLIKMLKIEQTDTDMMVLFKLGKFKQDKSKFYVIS